MKVQFYVLPSGRVPVRDFVKELEPRLRAEVYRVLERVEQDGFDATGVTFRQIRSKLWELRIQAGEAVRIFYVMLSGGGTVGLPDAEPTMVLLHAYLKKSRKAPPQEIALAERRLKEAMS